MQKQKKKSLVSSLLLFANAHLLKNNFKEKDSRILIQFSILNV